MLMMQVEMDQNSIFKKMIHFERKFRIYLLLQLDIFEHSDEICLLIRPLVVLIRQP